MRESGHRKTTKAPFKRSVCVPFFKLLEEVCLPLISHHPISRIDEFLKKSLRQEAHRGAPKAVSRHLSAIATQVNLSETPVYCGYHSGPLLLCVHLYHLGAFQFQVGTWDVLG